ncbi:MAG: DUF58 domain-containing protein [Ferruginibacter sp.]
MQEKVRKIGQSMEFEQIKEYVTGDDIRTINWKATARKGGFDGQFIYGGQQVTWWIRAS